MPSTWHDTSPVVTHQLVRHRAPRSVAVRSHRPTRARGPFRSAEDLDPRILDRLREMALHTIAKHTPGERNWHVPMTDTWARVPEIDVPVLTVNGTLDSPDLLADAERFANTACNGRSVLVAGTSHFPILEKPVTPRRRRPLVRVPETTPATRKETRTAGPAVPSATVPDGVKVPAPMMPPTPIAVGGHSPSDRSRPWPRRIPSPRRPRSVCGGESPRPSGTVPCASPLRVRQRGDGRSWRPRDARDGRRRAIHGGSK
ncbi:conserved hypothetical protein [Streptomyces sviceus ATCC 29083]|uniref:Uncharacterized protein n=1 Tax=Streptomyces sviceus (strain ATCC 29083 / DSM 924 / JCM 4929 / NBRC 13980 / NCIMB 11184 / NRRL 5439 / UC 5370) TaxID=463191 RepID=B5HS26_STRX2|nr:conserved hypothetical protein [Streptomyces sviceus ATCC 29083]